MLEKFKIWNISFMLGKCRLKKFFKLCFLRVDRVDGRRTPDHLGRRTPEHFSGRKTPDLTGRQTPDHSGRRTPDHSGRRTPDHYSGRRTPEPPFHNPRVGALFNKWRQVWLMAMERQRKLQDALDNLNEVRNSSNFLPFWDMHVVFVSLFNKMFINNSQKHDNNWSGQLFVNSILAFS